jgi:orotate phosphoribosyltransferase-like protein
MASRGKPTPPDLVRAILLLRSQRFSVRQIASELDVSKTTVCKYVPRQCAK